MNLINKKNFLFENVSIIEGVGEKLSIYLKKKRIEKVNDLIWFQGEVAERLKALVLKTSNGATRSWVRIPPSPPFIF